MGTPPKFNPSQTELLSLPLEGSTWVEGPAGTGKSTAAANRLLGMVVAGVPAQDILVLLPQRSLAGPYEQVLRSPAFPSGGRPDILTTVGLAQRLLSLFWPVTASAAGFARPDLPPVFLTMETAQYHMALVAEPLRQQGYFAGIRLNPNRLYSQLLDNLNKSAVVGFPHTQISARLSAAWNGPSSQMRAYEQAQEAVVRFREYCLAHNLLDFSLQLEVFRQVLWPGVLCRQFLAARYRHLLADNLEEDTPAAHDLLLDWIGSLQSALLVFDQDAGFRTFLGADPASAVRLKPCCSRQVVFEQPVFERQEFSAFTRSLAEVLKRPSDPSGPVVELTRILDRIRPRSTRFYPQMLDDAAGEIEHAVTVEGIPPGQVAVLAPFLSERLLFGLASRLEQRGIPHRSLRPSRSLGENAFAHCLLTLASLAHPAWKLPINREDFARMLSTAIPDLDPCRAGLLAEIVLPRGKEPSLPGDFEVLQADTKARITYQAGARYMQLRNWIEGYGRQPKGPLEVFFSRIFGELLTAPGFGFHNLPAAGEATANLIESAAKFRQAVRTTLPDAEVPREFIRAVNAGLISALYLRSWERGREDAVLLSPAFSFLLQNRPAALQIWLDSGSNAWYERLDQPLTHPYVLSRQWPANTLWDDTQETRTGRENLYRLTTGLLRRCTDRVVQLHCELGEAGFDQQGGVLLATARTLSRIRRAEGASEPAVSSGTDHV